MYTIGALIHNEGVVAYLEERGVHAISLEEARQLPAGSVALIRAHGIPVGDEEYLRSRGVELHDATCPVVKRIHKIVRERSAAGDDIVIVGDRTHDEVVGAASYASGNVRIISDDEEFSVGGNPVSVVFQTTVLTDKFGKINEIAENYARNGEKQLEFLILFAILL